MGKRRTPRKDIVRGRKKDFLNFASVGPGSEEATLEAVNPGGEELTEKGRGPGPPRKESDRKKRGEFIQE